MSQTGRNKSKSQTSPNWLIGEHEWNKIRPIESKLVQTGQNNKPVQTLLKTVVLAKIARF